MDTDSFREQLQNALAPAYTIQRELTGGGMSRVFVALEHALGRTVVVKVLKPELGAGVNRERFRREIMLAAQLQHPHIVPVLSAGEHGDLLWYTMPFVEGVSLRDSLIHTGKFSARTVTRVLHDVLDALAYAHRRGVIHRDIKPGNILHHGSHSLVTDFGVAKALSASLPHSGTTSVGIAIGTPAYMAPEQLAADPERRSSHGSLCGGSARVRAAHRRAAVQRQLAAGDDGGAAHAHADAARGGLSWRAASAGLTRYAAPRETSGRSSRDGGSGARGAGGVHDSCFDRLIGRRDRAMTSASGERAVKPAGAAIEATRSRGRGRGGRRPLS